MAPHPHPASTAIGVVAPLVAFIVSKFDQVEPWLRIISLLIGIAVGIQALARGRRRRKRGN